MMRSLNPISWLSGLWANYKRRRYWTAERQLENLRQMVYADHQWLAHDKVADALTTRYVAALAPDWYRRVHIHAGDFRREIGLEPVSARDFPAAKGHHDNNP